MWSLSVSLPRNTALEDAPYDTKASYALYHLQQSLRDFHDGKAVNNPEYFISCDEINYVAATYAYSYVLKKSYKSEYTNCSRYITYQGVGDVSQFVERLLPKLLEFASANDKIAECCLGFWYFVKGPFQDLEKAFIWFQKAANHGEPCAKNILGVMYYRGYYVAKDTDLAIKFWRECENSGLKDAINNLAVAILDGVDSQGDALTAKKLLQSAQSILIAQKNLGEQRLMEFIDHGFTKGSCVLEDIVALIDPAAQMGDVNAFLPYGILLAQQQYGGQSPYIWFKKALRAGIPDAANYIAVGFANSLHRKELERNQPYWKTRYSYNYGSGSYGKAKHDQQRKEIDAYWAEQKWWALKDGNIFFGAKKTEQFIFYLPLLPEWSSGLSSISLMEECSVVLADSWYRGLSVSCDVIIYRIAEIFKGTPISELKLQEASWLGNDCAMCDLGIVKLKEYDTIKTNINEPIESKELSCDVCDMINWIGNQMDGKLREAYELFKCAARKGNGAAHLMLGILSKDYGYSHSERIAFDCFSSAYECLVNHPRKYCFGISDVDSRICYRMGLQQETKRNYNEACVCYMRSIGYAPSLMRLSLMVLSGKCNKDLVKATLQQLVSVRKDKSEFYYWAKYLLGLMHERGIFGRVNIEAAIDAYNEAKSSKMEFSNCCIRYAASLRHACCSKIIRNEGVNKLSVYSKAFIDGCGADYGVWNLAHAFLNGINGYPKDIEMAKELFDHVAQGCFWPNTRTVELKDRAKQMLKDLGVSFVQQRLHVSDDDDYDEGWTVFPDELGQQYPNEGY